MIRIIYNWKVESKNLESFIKVWKKTTTEIHKTVKGARGSFMLQNAKEPTKIKTIARWDSLDDWKKFWHDNNHNQMQSMHDLGERTSVEQFKEIDDFTK
ncbi:antibiotic biosynthesis monooxygenase family protein [Croceitalea rosinachiae]|uniref:Antibiotic biosynthesis monooxygenase n=1 Tax=Croceitalea rosinachiae TaxID=3075596 RepID=A0ABU3A6G6_9FLAO|nr:antibiotic biosynthesis monooxygenase [Croceitalea sp. F388]MDT0605771.1 antibiotic biosynthesis monooxygenase [Croceitalea sp. F388]